MTVFTYSKEKHYVLLEEFGNHYKYSTIHAGKKAIITELILYDMLGKEMVRNNKKVVPLSSFLPKVHAFIVGCGEVKVYIEPLKPLETTYNTITELLKNSKNNRFRGLDLKTFNILTNKLKAHGVPFSLLNNTRNWRLTKCDKLILVQYGITKEEKKWDFLCSEYIRTEV